MKCQDCQDGMVKKPFKTKHGTVYWPVPCQRCNGSGITSCCEVHDEIEITGDKPDACY